MRICLITGYKFSQSESRMNGCSALRNNKTASNRTGAAVIRCSPRSHLTHRFLCMPMSRAISDWLRPSVSRACLGLNSLNDRLPLFVKYGRQIASSVDLPIVFKAGDFCGPTRKTVLFSAGKNFLFSFCHIDGRNLKTVFTGSKRRWTGVFNVFCVCQINDVPHFLPLFVLALGNLYTY